jgi:hypothetical protein
MTDDGRGQTHVEERLAVQVRADAFATTTTPAEATMAGVAGKAGAEGPVDGKERSVEIVVSRFCENISWLRDPQFAGYRKVVYNKGTTPTGYQVVAAPVAPTAVMLSEMIKDTKRSTYLTWVAKVTLLCIIS